MLAVRSCLRPLRVPKMGTVALSATEAEPAPVGAANEHQFRGAHVFTVHFNTGISAHLMPGVGWCGSMQQCPVPSVVSSTNTNWQREALGWHIRHPQLRGRSDAIADRKPMTLISGRSALLGCRRGAHSRRDD